MPIADRFDGSLSRRKFVQAGFSSAPWPWPGGNPRRPGSRPDVEAAEDKVGHHRISHGRGQPSRNIRHEAGRPPEIRGEFSPIASSVPGLQMCEHLPMLAKVMDHCAGPFDFPSRRQPSSRNPSGTHRCEDSRRPLRSDRFAQTTGPVTPGHSTIPEPRQDGVPTGRHVPTFLMEGPLVWPGQHAGFLTAKHDPWHIKQDPNLPISRSKASKRPTGRFA